MLPDYVRCVFWTDKDLRKDNIILKILQKVLSFGNPFSPNKMFLNKETKNRFVRLKIPKDYNRIEKAINVYDYLSFGFMREENDYFHLDFARRSYDGVNKFGRKADPNIAVLELERKLFNDESIVLKYLEACKLLYLETGPYYGYTHESDDVQKIRRKDEWLKIFHTPQFCLIYWVNFFGPSVVENYGGKSKFLNAPCWKVEELDDGGILLILYPNPLNPEKPEKREIQNNVLKYFGLQPI
jgi:hypothetical protein